ncbi:PKP3 isoform 6, partial [Pongo abelii]
FDGLRKLVFIKKKRDSPDSEKSSRAASSLLANLWQYNKLHRDFRAVCFPSPGQAGTRVQGMGRWGRVSEEASGRMETRDPERKGPGHTQDTAGGTEGRGPHGQTCTLTLGLSPL